MGAAMGIASFAPRWLAVLVAGVFSAQTLAPGVGLAALPAPPADALAAAEQQIDRIIDALDAARQRIDRSRFDMDALALRLGGDADGIFAFVRDEIGYQAYVGAMRGPLGTLLAKSGNAYDKALLLSDLLRRAGFETRFAIGRLSPEQAAALAKASLQQSEPASSPEQQIALGAGILAAAGLEASEIEAIAEDTRASIVGGRAALRQEVESNLKFLEEALAGAGIRPSSSDVVRYLTDVATDHCWVQYKDATGKWTDLDPTAPGQSTGATAANPDSVAAELPEDKVHALTVRIRLRTGETPQGGSETMTDTVLLEKKFDIPLIAGQVVHIGNIPDLSASADAQDLSAAIAGVNRFDTVVAVGKDPPVLGLGFALDGRIVGQEKQSAPPAAPAFGGLGNILQGVADQVGGVPETSSRIVGEWIEYTLAVPQQDGTPALYNYRREILSPETVIKWSPAGASTLETNRTETAALRAMLVRDVELMPIVGAIDSRLLSSRMADVLIASRALLRAIPSMSAKEPDKALDLGGSENPAVGLVPLMYATAVESRLSDMMAEEFPGIPAYRSVPALVSHEIRLQTTPDGGLLAGRSFDIIHNLDAARVGTSERPFDAALRRGILETAVERQLLESVIGNSVVRPLPVSTSSVFDEAKRQGIAPAVLTPDEDGRARLAALVIPEPDKALIAADLDRGYVVVTPSQKVAVGERQLRGWWRVDPRTGTTLGQLSSNGGAGEYGELIYVMEFIVQHWDKLAFLLRLSVVFASYGLCVLDSDAGDENANVGAKVVDHLACAAAAVVAYMSWIPKNPMSADAAATLAMALAGVITTSGKAYFLPQKK